MVYTICKQDTDEVVGRIDTKKKLVELGKGYALVTTEQNDPENEPEIKSI